jgi:hypothetical protein
MTGNDAATDRTGTVGLRHLPGGRFPPIDTSTSHVGFRCILRSDNREAFA